MMWCEHIYRGYSEQKWIYTGRSMSGKTLFEDETNCAYCGAKRPEKPKAEYYWQELKELWKKRAYKTLPNDEVFMEIANLIDSGRAVKAIMESEKPKTLAEKLEATKLCFANGWLTIESSKRLAEVAREHFRGILDSLNGQMMTSIQDYYDKIVSKLAEDSNT